ncbi:hypothetical protein PR202_gb21061 [Eleusine coracana subsp. coracana]|uniref:PGG domain-containing protein n=1 Tax=Eleusine coracana subsp. coracana TaxID=191504 RepID=A0AAV5FCA3_ELECO|nr:hypothetical protein PR202_gb21061 [Eleusine coracana subsp. coracana]
MAEAAAAPVEFGPEKKTLSVDLLQVLTAGNATRLEEILSSDSQTNGHVAINVQATAQPPPEPGTSSCCLLGVTSNGNTALHLVASRGHAELAKLICEKAPSLVATRNTGLDTPLHCAARGGHRDVAACLLSTMLNCGIEEAAAMRATNRRGDTALHEAVRHRRAEVVDLFMADAPDLASVVSDDGVSPLYLAATTESVQMVRLLLRPSPDGTPSPASSAGREGRTALHAAAVISKDVINKKDEELSKQQESVEGYIKGNGTIASALIATVTFTAAVTVPGGFIADDHSHPGTAILARRFAFRAFAASNAVAFLCSIVATCYFIYGGAREVPASHRWSYNAPASGLLPVAVQFMIAAFAFGFHLVLGAANLGLKIFVYFVSSASVLFCFPGIWVPFFLGYVKVLRRRGGWMGLLVQVKRIVFAVLICATFVVAIVLEITLADY